MNLKIVKISEIKINERNRRYSPAQAKELSESISEIGLLHPIIIDKDNMLIAGLHRLEAAKLLGWTEIPCNIFNINGNNAEELAEIHENLVRVELNELEKADLLYRSKQIYELRHPESIKANIAKRNLKQFADKENNSVSVPKNNDISMGLTKKSFADSIAENIGLSPRSVRQSIQIAKGIAPVVKDIIKNKPLANSKNDLITLSKLKPDMQEAVCDIISKSGIKKVKEAIYEVRKETLNRSFEKAEMAVTADGNKSNNLGLKVSAGDVFKLGGNILICGDNTDFEIINYISQYHYSLAFADPPYNLGIASYDRSQFIWTQDYLAKISDIVAVTPGINNIKFFIKNTAMSYKWLIICHVKNLQSGCAVGYTHYYPIFLFSDLKSINFGIKDFFSITLPPMPQEDKEIANKRQKPAKLLTYIINSFTKEGDFILDPFAGSGQTLIVSEALNRKCVTIEILPDMVKAIINRFENKFGIKPVKIKTLQVKNTNCI